MCHYTFDILNALDVKNGAAHCEIKMSSNGPCLIEIGARVDGAGASKIMEYCTKPSLIGERYNQEIAFIYAYCNQELFDSIPYRYELEKYGNIINSNSKFEGIPWKNIYLQNLIEQLEKIVDIVDIKYHL